MHWYYLTVILISIILVVFGATGFTGELTCEYLAEIKDDVRISSKNMHLESWANIVI